MSEETKAPFNMAISTLEALRSILADIKGVYSNPYLPNPQKQELKVGLVKRFYVDCSPLLGEKVTEKFKGVLDIQPTEAKVIDRGVVQTKKRIIFDWELEKKLDKYLIDLQLELQKEKYYMPPRRDKGKAVAEF